MPIDNEGKNPVNAYLDGLSPTSRPALSDSIEMIARFFGATTETFAWHKVRYEQSQQLRTFLLGKYKSRTANKALAALRGVLKAAWRLGMMSTDDYHHARDVKVVKISEPMAGRMLSMDELRALVNADSGKNRKRNAALVALMYAAGLRRFEVARLKVGHYERDIGQLTVKGKRNKTRQITIHRDWRAPIEDWLDGKEADAWMFPGHGVGSISLGNVSAILETQRSLTNVADFSSHDLRRTFISNLLDAGADLAIVKRLAGHDNVNTTAMYDRRGREAEDAAINKLKGL